MADGVRWLGSRAACGAHRSRLPAAQAAQGAPRPACFRLYTAWSHQHELEDAPVPRMQVGWVLGALGMLQVPPPSLLGTPIAVRPTPTTPHPHPHPAPHQHAHTHTQPATTATTPTPGLPPLQRTNLGNVVPMSSLEPGYQRPSFVED